LTLHNCWPGQFFRSPERNAESALQLACEHQIRQADRHSKGDGRVRSCLVWSPLLRSLI
jgi:hypothetical protein